MKNLILTVAMLLLATVQLFGQLRAGCTANSLTIAVAESLSVAGAWEYSCYAQNIGTTPQTLSVAGFALDFIELQQIAPGDVLDIFQQKQKRTTAAKIALGAEIVSVAALAVMSQQYWMLPAKAIAGVGLAAYGSAKAGQYFTGKIPPLTNAVSGLLTQDQTIPPGGSYVWKLYASNNTTVPVKPTGQSARRMLRMGPGTVIPVRILTPVGTTIHTQNMPICITPACLNVTASAYPTLDESDRFSAEFVALVALNTMR